MNLATKKSLSLRQGIFRLLFLVAEDLRPGRYGTGQQKGGEQEEQGETFHKNQNVNCRLSPTAGVAKGEEDVSYQVYCGVSGWMRAGCTSREAILSLTSKSAI